MSPSMFSLSSVSGRRLRIGLRRRGLPSCRAAWGFGRRGRPPSQQLLKQFRPRHRQLLAPALLRIPRALAPRHTSTVILSMVMLIWHVMVMRMACVALLRSVRAVLRTIVSSP